MSPDSEGIEFCDKTFHTCGLDLNMTMKMS